jgi:hypothetical protein
MSARIKKIGCCLICKREKECVGVLCGSCRTRVRRFLTRKACILYLGAKCIKCGWKGEQVGFDIHHIGKKEFTICGSEYKSWASLKLELDKCILLCATCHRLEHTASSDQLSEYISNRYSGTVFNDVLAIKGGALPNSFNSIDYIYVCDRCGVEFHRSKRKKKNQKFYCSTKCTNDGKLKIVWPSKEELKILIDVKSMVAVGRQLGVSDNAIRKHCRKIGLEISSGVTRKRT